MIYSSMFLRICTELEGGFAESFLRFFCSAVGGLRAVCGGRSLNGSYQEIRVVGWQM